MTIAEFAKKRKVDQQAVYKYINRHSDLFEGHLSNTQPRQLDEEALKILSEKYPEINPIEVVEDTDAYKQLVEAKNQIIKMQQQICVYEKMKSDSEASQRLLEQKENDNEWLKGQLEKAQKEAADERQKSETAKKEAEEARLEAERLRSRGFWARVFNK